MRDDQGDFPTIWNPSRDDRRLKGAIINDRYAAREQGAQAEEDGLQDLPLVRLEGVRRGEVDYREGQYGRRADQKEYCPAD